jgi:hypothetical protein
MFHCRAIITEDEHVTVCDALLTDLAARWLVYRLFELAWVVLRRDERTGATVLLQLHSRYNKFNPFVRKTIISETRGKGRLASYSVSQLT